MKRWITVGDQLVEYTLSPNVRTRRVSIAVYPGGEIRVTMPMRGSVASVERFLRMQEDWISHQLDKMSKVTKPKYVPGGTKADYAARKSEARKFVRERLKYFNEFYNFDFGRISIRNQKTRWGSCSVDGNLSFNYKIVTLPIRMADYIIVHELCHTREFNHSPRFWELVSRAMPEHKKLRKQLRGEGLVID